MIDADDVVFIQFLIEFHNFLFQKVKRSDCGKRCNYFQQNKKFHGRNCFVSTKKRICFPESFRVLTEKFSYEDYIEFFIGFSRRILVMTDCKIARFCEKVGIDIGYFNGREILPS